MAISGALRKPSSRLADLDVDAFINAQMAADLEASRARLADRRRLYLVSSNDDVTGDGEEVDDDDFEGGIFTAASLEDHPIPPRDWLVRDLVPSGTVTLLGGDGGTGKSLIALQLAYAVATGGLWLGKAVAPGRALYVSAEDDKDELHRRLNDILLPDLGRTFADLGQLDLRSLAGKDALLANVDRSSDTLTRTELFCSVELYMIRRRPKLLVLDTLADLFPGNENDRAQARQFVGLLRGLAIRHECAVLLLAHPSLSGLNSGSGTSGSTAWNNSVRSRLYLERVVQDGYEPNPDARVLSTKKANYGRTGGEIAMTWQGGRFVADEQEPEADRIIGSVKAERVFLSLLRLFSAQGRTVNSKGSSTYAPTAFAKHPDSEGVTKAAFATAMEMLLASERIKIITEGPASRVVSRLVEVEQ